MTKVGKKNQGMWGEVCRTTLFSTIHLPCFLFSGDVLQVSANREEFWTTSIFLILLNYDDERDQPLASAIGFPLYAIIDSMGLSGSLLFG